MRATYRARPEAISRCIDQTAERVRELRGQREGPGGENPAINRALRKEQTKVRERERERYLGIICFFSCPSCD